MNIEKLQKVIDIYQAQINGSKKYEEYKKQLKRYIRGELDSEYFPVYYSVIKKGNKSIIMLSPAAITREVFDTKIDDMIGDYTSCKDVDCVCSACKLFGMLSGTKAITSRIRIADMEHKDSIEGVYDEQLWTLKQLDTPKLQNLEFYMKKPANNAWFWTYDYYIDDRGELHLNKNPEINGRKFYWHHPSVDKTKITTKPGANNITVNPIKKGNVFEGKIYFNDLTEEELSVLVYLLNVGESGDIDKRTHGYKLGFAKPLGFGSVAMKVDSVEVRSVGCDNDNIVRKIENKTSIYEGKDKHIADKCKRDLLTITDFNAIDSNMNIIYPVLCESRISESDDKGFAWFVNNHKAYKIDKYTGRKKENQSPNHRTQMVYKEYMKPMNPELMAVDVSMNKFIRK